jgi:S-methylmethionine-dependent homocysteine/selenocysteine methylase
MEAEALVELLRDEFPQNKAYVCFSCKDDGQLNSGELFSKAIECIEAADTGH